MGFKQPLPTMWSADRLLQAASVAPGDSPVAPSADDLDQADAENFVLDFNMSAQLGFPVADLGVTTGHKVLLVGDARYKDVTVGPDTYRFGVALRAIIRVTDIQPKANLTLPAVAASVQLGLAEAAGELVVRGYRGDLKFPSWQSFNVEAYAEYQQEVSKLADAVFSDRANQSPVLLQSTVIDPTLPGTASALGHLIALSAIAQGKCLIDAQKHVALADGASKAALKATYLTRVSGDELAVPAPEVREAASDSLGGFHLSRRRFAEW